MPIAAIPYINLKTALGGALPYPVDEFYLRPSVEMMAPYLVALGQSLMLTLAANNEISGDRFWGERNLLEWPLRMSLEWPLAEVPKLMYVSGLSKAAEYRSGVLDEFKTRTDQFLKDARHQGSVVEHLAPLVWKIFGTKDELSHLQEPGLADQSEQYREWAGRVINES